MSIPSSVNSIGGWAFQNNSTLNKVTITGRGAIKSGVFTYGSGYNLQGIFAASGSSAIALVIADGIPSIGWQAFQNNQLTSVKIPSSVTSIGDSAFQYNQLTSVSIPSSVTSIGGGAFQYNKLTEVILPAALYYNRGGAFANNPAGLKFYAYNTKKPGNKGHKLK